MRIDVYSWVAVLQPSREQVNRQREAVHFGEQRNDKRRKSAERPPIPLRAWMIKTKREDQEDPS